MLNALSFGATILFAGLWLQQWTRYSRLAVLGTATVALSPVLIRVTTMLWTESLFILFTVLALYGLSRTSAGATGAVLIAIAAFAAAATLTRYIGVAVIGTGLVVLLLSRSDDRLSRMRRMAAFAVLALLPPILWLARNYRVSSTLTGERAWAAVTGTQPPLFISPGVAVVCAALVVLLVAVGRECRTRIRVGEEVRPLLVMGVFSAIYLGLVLLLASQGASNPIDYRLLAPLYVPLTLAAVAAVDGPLRRATMRDRRTSALMAAPYGFGILLVASLAVVFGEGRTMLREGAGGYATDVWVNSDVLQFLREHLPTGRIYSNAPEAIHHFGAAEATQSPSKYVGFSSRIDENSMPAFEAELRSTGGDAFLVWFERAPYDGYLYRLHDVRAAVRMEPVMRGSHGAVYRILEESMEPLAGEPGDH